MPVLTSEEALLFVQVPHRFIHSLLREGNFHRHTVLNHTQGRTLLMLTEREQTSMLELSRRVGMPKGSFTQVIDSLIEKGLAKRKRDPSDRRAVLVSITDEGRQLTNHIHEQIRKHLEAVLDLLGPEEARSVLEALRTLQKTTQLIEERTIHAAE